MKLQPYKRISSSHKNAEKFRFLRQQKGPAMEQEKQFHGRANILLGVFVICLLFFVLILYDAQIVNGLIYELNLFYQM